MLEFIFYFFYISENYDKIKNVINRTGSDDNEY